MKARKPTQSSCCGHDDHHDHQPRKTAHDHTAGHSHDDRHSHSHDDDDHDHSHGGGDLKQEIIVTAIVVVLFLIGFIFEQQLHNTPYSIAEYAVLIPAYLLSGWGVLSSAGRNILKGKVFDENFLMTIATLGAIAIHLLPEAVAVMLFFRIGELFQESAVGRSRKSISALLEVRPDTANLKINGEVRQVSPESVKVGDMILVKPGEKVPLDGEILDGNSQVDTSALTGESVPRTVKPGETVLAGMINQSGVLTIRTTKLFGESSIARILELVENASSKKAETEKFIRKFAKIYTPIVVFLSLAVAILPPLFMNNPTDADRFRWVYNALVLLVISCPCGLVISIPLGYFGGVGGAAKRGVLVKGSTYLDTLAAVNTVVFDKTGTLTQGVFKVTQIIPKNGFTEEKLLALAAQVESHSNHPVAQSIRTAYGRAIGESQVQDYKEIAGHGIQAKVGNQLVIAGNDRLLHRENIAHDVCQVDGTVVHLAANGTYAGRIIIADELKEDAVEAIRSLRKIGVEKTIMLTGDNQSVADGVARQLGLSGYRAELLPEGKVEAIEQILRESGKGKVAFVGDGINDAPVIARADVGMAMGGLGSDAAIETADVVIMTDAPSKIAEAIQIGRKTHRIVIQNIVLAMAVKGFFIILGAFGLASLWEAVFADVGVALLAVLNANRVVR
ncbi:zinc-transporting P-type ATPase (plasmid) [Leptolyngbya boryana NIES-2135]|jgi:Cd2+/Zn2+-exporting ATPase|uniref:P-type Zn(2+) transporter n=1 Tax=Leptolyngbya boryana NIES-2135 TaxID=1973484 RepID=A0A1Z4JRN7_LEPBY|nr:MULTISPECIES: heavy metal translocating P-type ATPase [Leptolyngbya]BAY59366.1 zinc-transporting P-type ATPase [Leptolyngbya boryana NIES-2135]MBD2372954.1 cadmium-translocating P-type ATPase [Leptolyngbya sp. FACHB-238]MBD2397293.1 cadmium-translocating P-type ATPase [Leptolyngbya sp. FACHB-239]MBD2403902.1 cadmium-translocating P-type ATPase [Leptolyngbya sp. FACHB-402]ULP33198.1 cadmium-translocating P-type ATPase [Leptolyngbya boryana IU 594]